MKNTFKNTKIGFGKVVILLFSLILLTTMLVACTKKEEEPGSEPPSQSQMPKIVGLEDGVHIKDMNANVGDTLLLTANVQFDGELEFRWYTGSFVQDDVSGGYAIGYQTDVSFANDDEKFADKGLTLKEKSEYEAMSEEEIGKVGFFVDGKKSTLPLRMRESFKNPISYNGQTLTDAVVFRMTVKGKGERQTWSEPNYIDFIIQLD